METFEPGKWKANWPNSAFNKRTVRDSYWGAKLVGSFTDEQIAAAVAEGHLPAEAAEKLTRILIQRRDKVVGHWYAKVAPIENLTARTAIGTSEATLDLSFDDLGLEVGLWTPGETRYAWQFENPGAGTRISGEEPAGPGTRQTLRLRLQQLPENGGSAVAPDYPIVRISVVRPGASRRKATGYLQWKGPAVGYAVVGLEH